MGERLAAVAWLSVESFCAGFSRAFGDAIGTRFVALLDRERTGAILARSIQRNLPREKRRGILDRATGETVFEDTDPLKYAQLLVMHEEERRRIATATAGAGQ